MTAKLIDGKLISGQIKDEVKAEITKITNAGGKAPALAVVIVGDDPASKIYVSHKEKACDYTGITSRKLELPAETREGELLALIDELNNDSGINGILVQLPLPRHINADKVLLAIKPEKDVDCFHPFNVGLLATGGGELLPCTPAGVIELLKRSNIEIEGKNCVVIGRSNIVGKPMAALLLQENGTPTICHSRTKKLTEVAKTADILIAALGKPRFVTKEMVKPGAVVIDVGIHNIDGKKLCGDVDFESVAEVASHITPVPGGVGPMTIAMLMRNCLTAWERVQ